MKTYPKMAQYNADVVVLRPKTRDTHRNSAGPSMNSCSSHYSLNLSNHMPEPKTIIFLESWIAEKLMIDSTDFLIFLVNHGFSFASGVPCSYFKQMIDKVQMLDAISYVPATREDEAIGIASGIAFGGKRAFVIMQNSGYATIGDALTSLAQLYRLPMLIIISYRGLEPDRDFPEHSLMGEVTEDLLKSYRVPFWDLKKESWHQTLEDAIARMEETSRPVALLIREGVVG